MTKLLKRLASVYLIENTSTNRTAHCNILHHVYSIDCNYKLSDILCITFAFLYIFMTCLHTVYLVDDSNAESENYVY